MKRNATVKTIEALEARVHFGSVMDEAEKTNTRFLVSKRGKPKLIMLSVNDYLENILKEDNLLTQIHLKAKETGLDRISEEEIESEIKAARRDARERKRKHR
jgi:prevent-host-death family protein